ncbi:MAG TPA: hypothetical protein VHC90_05565 [Bryobacteraceae bacterium]|nr:hypothetical protein [Bryobacteraceae bacterium]
MLQSQFRTKTFQLSDWKFVCNRASAFFVSHSVPALASWLAEAANNPALKKPDQDRLCLIVALWFHHGRECLMAGNTASGYIVVPHEPSVLSEMASRCIKTGRSPEEWIRVFRTPGPRAEAMTAAATSAAPTPEIRPPAPSPPKPAAVDRTAWTLPKIAALLNQHHQRATYGAVAGVLGVLPRGAMQGRSKSPEYSWIVAAGNGIPTGYENGQIHPECLRQIREYRGRVNTSAEKLLAWLQRAG